MLASVGGFQFASTNSTPFFVALPAPRRAGASVFVVP
jgi:hypothetical protein